MLLVISIFIIIAVVNTDVPLIHDRVMVPSGVINETLGADVNSDQDIQAANIKHDRVMVPSVVISETLGADVKSDQGVQAANIIIPGDAARAYLESEVTTNPKVKFQGQGMITLTFDDARKDFARVAVPIMQRYHLTATTFAITGWTDGSYNPSWSTKSGADGACSITQLQYCNSLGFEIAAHGDQHMNTEADLNACIVKLNQWGITRDGKVETFASPNNTVNSANISVNSKWFADAGLSCARSGIAVGSTNINVLNNMVYPPNNKYMLTASIITSKTTFTQLLPILQDAIKNKKWCILELHSILNPGDLGYGNDMWYWDASNFTQLCEWLSQMPESDGLVTTMRDGFKYASE